MLCLPSYARDSMHVGAILTTSFSAGQARERSTSISEIQKLLTFRLAPPLPFSHTHTHKPKRQPQPRQTSKSSTTQTKQKADREIRKGRDEKSSRYVHIPQQTYLRSLHTNCTPTTYQTVYVRNIRHVNFRTNCRQTFCGRRLHSKSPGMESNRTPGLFTQRTHISRCKMQTSLLLMLTEG